MSEEKNQTGINFLDDSPVTEDELKLHENIAKTIKRIISLVKDKNKKIIGLFGSWGSGKSTVIEMLKKEEGESNVSIFDSWSNKGDFLKRAFLLELAKNLGVEKEEYIKENNKDKLTIETVLTRKIINKTVDSEPLSNLSKSIKILSGLILIAIIIVAFSKILEYLVIPWIPVELISKLDFFKKYQWIIRLIIFLIILGIYIWQWKKINEILTNFINFYFLKKVDITESHTTKEDLEFTNYDYENYLKYILNKASLDEEKPFIIVFDNLDRVDDETVLNTLSLIQLTNEVLNENKNVYFIIPIDKERLEKTIKTMIAGDSDNEPEKEKFSKDFLEKIFPYKVNIPYIVHSEWRQFFNKRTHEAFGSNINDKYIFVIRMIFEKSINESKEKNLTPREIKNFINDLLENYLYWENFENKPDIRLQALYVALNNYFSKDFKDYIDYIENLPIRKNVEDNEGTKINKVIDICKKYFNKDEIKESLLKQHYKGDEIYTLFVDKTINAIRNENIDELQHIFNLLKEKERVEALIGKVLEQEEAFKENINLLLKLYKSLKVLGFYENFEEGIITDLEELIKDIDLLSTLEDSQVDKFSEILKTNENMKKLFIKKSAEIITTIPEEESNEEKR